TLERFIPSTNDPHNLELRVVKPSASGCVYKAELYNSIQPYKSGLSSS
ncbi:hypothetical protein CEXT_690941, partial [Caerostris extrusa]